MESGPRPDHDVALTAIYEAVAPGGRPADVWRRFAAALTLTAGNDRMIPRVDVEDAARQIRPGLAVSQLLAASFQLGVLSGRGERLAYSPRAAEEIARALELAGSSLRVDTAPPAWVPVGTVPDTLRRQIAVPGLRRTAGVLLDMLDRARHDVWLTAPFVERAGVAFLSDAIIAALGRGVRLHLLTRPDAMTEGALAELVSTIEQRSLSERLTIVHIQTEASELGTHAKVCLVDDHVCYLGSANLTAHGLGRNLELGARLHGPDVATIRAALEAIATLGRRVYPPTGVE